MAQANEEGRLVSMGEDGLQANEEGRLVSMREDGLQANEEGRLVSMREGGLQANEKDRPRRPVLSSAIYYLRAALTSSAELEKIIVEK